MKQNTANISKLLISICTLASLSSCAPGSPNLSPAEEETTHELVSPDPGTDNAISGKVSATFQVPSYSATEQDSVLKKYAYLDPNHLVPDNLLKEAVLYFNANESHIGNKKVLGILDFSQFSGNKRFYFVNLSTGAVWNTYAAHGKNSDADSDGYATSFSNTSGSEESSLGFYLTAEIYSGTHGSSMRLDGLSATNSNARTRAIVVHGADYVKDAPVKQGRSWGCPAVPMSLRDKVLDLLKGGTLVYAGLSSGPKGTAH